MKNLDLIHIIRHEMKLAVSQIMNDTINEKFDPQKLNFNIEKTKNLQFGDFSSNIALVCTSKIENVMTVAQKIVNHLEKKIFSKIEITKPGFINFWIKPAIKSELLQEILTKKAKFGLFDKKHLFYNIEFVSANPTGLLHIGHARNAAIGDTLARVWSAYGIKVDREYYINDGGNQVEKLAMSVLIRYQMLFDKKVSLPEDSYHGEEIVKVAQLLKEKYQDQFVDVKQDGIKITQAKPAELIKNFAKKFLLEIIKNDLKNFGVEFDIWFPESKLYESNIIEPTIRLLKDHTYTFENALWLKTTPLGDDKDRVLIKSDKTYTYFVPDIAYHNIKLSRGYDKCFNIWGADHASYATRMNIAMQLLGYPADKLQIIIMQMVKLIKDNQEFKMSKRSGTSFTLQDLITTIGKDASRWYLVSQPANSHLEIDIAKATDKNADNQVYYVQYAHARINQLMAKATYHKPKSFGLLTLPIEQEIINALLYYRHTIRTIANNYEPNKLTLYLYNLAKLFHSYYGSNKIIDENNLALSIQRYWLSACVKQVIANGLKLMAITPLEKM